MNKKIFILGILIFALLFSHCSFSINMKNIVFRGLQSLSIGGFLFTGTKIAQKYDALGKKMEVLVHDANMPELTEKFIRKELSRLHVSDENIQCKLCDGLEMKFKIDNKTFSGGSSMGVVNDNIVLTPSNVALRLDEALQHEVHDNDTRKLINMNKIILDHEIGHIAHKDCHNRKKFVHALPWLVQAGFSGAAYGFKKFFNIGSPRTWLQMLSRSMLLGISFPTKIVAGAFGYFFYVKYQEKRADRYACEHSESKEELEAFRDFFKNSENDSLAIAEAIHASSTVPQWLKCISRQILVCDPTHPSSRNRAAMAQEYIDNWDKNHPVSQDTQIPYVKKPVFTPPFP